MRPAHLLYLDAHAQVLERILCAESVSERIAAIRQSAKTCNARASALECESAAFCAFAVLTVVLYCATVLSWSPRKNTIVGDGVASACPPASAPAVAPIGRAGTSGAIPDPAPSSGSRGASLVSRLRVDMVPVDGDANARQGSYSTVCHTPQHNPAVCYEALCS